MAVRLFLDVLMDIIEMYKHSKINFFYMPQELLLCFSYLLYGGELIYNKMVIYNDVFKCCFQPNSVYVCPIHVILFFLFLDILIWQQGEVYFQELLAEIKLHISQMKINDNRAFVICLYTAKYTCQRLCNEEGLMGLETRQ